MIKEAIAKIKDARKQKNLDSRLLDFLTYRSLYGKKRSDDDLSDLAIKQWESENKDCSKWKLYEDQK